MRQKLSRLQRTPATDAVGGGLGTEEGVEVLLTEDGEDLIAEEAS